jgi:hypothetical protein
LLVAVGAAMTLMRTPVRHLVIFLLLAVAALATELKIGTLNCYLLFDPQWNTPGMSTQRTE